MDFFHRAPEVRRNVSLQVLLVAKLGISFLVLQAGYLQLRQHRCIIDIVVIIVNIIVQLVAFNVNIITGLKPLTAK